MTSWHYKNDVLELDGQIIPIEELDIYLNSESSSEIDYGDGIDEDFENNDVISCISSY